MGYYEDFQLLIEKEDCPNFLRLWEEYCQADRVDGKELVKILESISNSIFAPSFGKSAETILPLWQLTAEEIDKEKVLKLAIDLQTTNSPIFADLATKYLKEKYSDLKDFNEMMRLVGLRGRAHFQGAISHFELLHHMKKGNFVFHKGGWGVGEIMEFSLLRQHVLIEFEGIGSPKDLSFENAFRSLIPLSKEHFLARRFGNPDDLEKEAKEDPLKIITLLLRDLGPKNAIEIKEELCGLVIPENEWTRFWQLARSKIKKDTKIQSPKGTKEPFVLREEAVGHDQEFFKQLTTAKTVKSLITTVYTFIRDFPEVLKNEELKTDVRTRLEVGLIQSAHEAHLKIQLYFLLEEMFPKEYAGKAQSEIKELENCESVINLIEVGYFKKKFLTVIRENRSDYYSIFSRLFFLVPQSLLRDYLFKELGSKPDLLREKLLELLDKVTVYPEVFFWYFQKMCLEEVPLSEKKYQGQFLEAFFVLMHYIEENEEFKDLLKKMHNFLSHKRYLVFREIIQGSTPAFLLEVLLLASKCQSLSKSELRTLQSLAEVVQPSLKEGSKEKPRAEKVIWTTAEGYRKVQERLHHIGTVETVNNAREIEVARSHGDLRENSEYKFALERRSQLQAEMKTLSDQIHHARILTKEDIAEDSVGVGNIVELLDGNGQRITYTLLGPWDADPEKHILSSQSKFAESMMGHRRGESFEFQGETFKISSIRSFL